jgi:uncharacterized protein (TIGR02466 family)
MKVKTVFSSFLAIESLAIDNNALTDFAYNTMKVDAGRTASNELGWQSNDIPLNTIEIQPLINAIQTRLNNLHDHFNFRNNRSIILDNLWVNINKTYCTNVPHKHIGLFSGVYYVKGFSDSGNIIFLNPIEAHSYVISNDMYDANNEFNSGSCYELPQPGKLVIFPSWLTHFVKPNLNKEDRISISFNARLA